ncbi:MAG: LysM peptidoglycan-binding domain-containing protein [Cyclobacteriaceae bacterium]|nr:LysM peptidoglycan-binding domain-containing protein [Cyclobacteriaceae bacterium]
MKKSSDVNGKEIIVNDNSIQKTSADKNVKKEDIYHIVKSNETLFGICRTYDVTIGELRQWNDIDNLDLLHIGQRILIKKDIETSKTNQITYTSTQFKTYTVKPDDTLYDIARIHDITIKELMDLNNKEDFIIKEGEVLKIKAHKYKNGT